MEGTSQEVLHDALPPPTLLHAPDMRQSHARSDSDTLVSTCSAGRTSRHSHCTCRKRCPAWPPSALSCFFAILRRASALSRAKRRAQSSLVRSADQDLLSTCSHTKSACRRLHWRVAAALRTLPRMQERLDPSRLAVLSYFARMALASAAKRLHRQRWCEGVALTPASAEHHESRAHLSTSLSCSDSISITSCTAAVR